MSILDLDYQVRLWPSEQEATAWVQQALGRVGVAIGNLEGCRIAAGETSPDAAALVLLERGVEMAVVKQEIMGTLIRTATEWVYVPVASARIRNGFGADDDFDRAMYRDLLQDRDLARTFAFASVADAIAASRLECSTAMPRIDEVERLMTADP